MRQNQRLQVSIFLLAIPLMLTGTVLGVHDCEEYPMLYGNSGVADQYLVLRSSVGDLRELNFGDPPFSLCVPYGTTVVLFDHPGFRGNRVVIDGPAVIENLHQNSLGHQKWVRRVRSIQVLAPAFVPGQFPRARSHGFEGGTLTGLAPGVYLGNLD